MEEQGISLRAGQQWRGYAMKGAACVALRGEVSLRRAADAVLIEPLQQCIHEGCAHVVADGGWIIVEARRDAEFGWAAPERERPLARLAAMLAGMCRLSRRKRQRPAAI